MRLTDLLEALFRWAHLIAGIMWVGNSMLFNWLDRNLERSAKLSRLSQGKIFMVHSGAFYDVEKKLLAPGEMPPTLHWFKWQNGITWMTGIALMVLVYYLDGAAFLRDPNVRELDPIVAITLSVSAILTAWILYDGLWRSVGESHPRFATGLSIALLFGSIYAYTQMFSGRGAYIQTGVMIGTLMTGNVWLCILPSQRELIRATKAGEEQDKTLSLRAKQRSIHNNYLTFPLLFIMLSNHTPNATLHYLNWLILIAVLVGGAGVRFFMNIRYRGGGRQLPMAAWLAPALAMASIAAGGLFVITHIKPPTLLADHPVGFARAQEIVVKRCQPCHSAHPKDPAYPVAPNNVVFDTPEQMKNMAPKMFQRAIETRSMPFLNKTQITPDERAELGRWIDDGAKLE